MARTAKAPEPPPEPAERPVKRRRSAKLPDRAAAKDARPVGRPLKLTPEARDRIVKGVQLGAPLYQCAAMARVSYNSLRSWMDRGEAESDRIDAASEVEGADLKPVESEFPFLELFLAIKEAEGAAVVTWLARIETAAKAGQWQAAAWKLERKYPNDFGRRAELTGPGGGSIPIAIIGMSVDEL